MLIEREKTEAKKLMKDGRKECIAAQKGQFEEFVCGNCEVNFDLVAKHHESTVHVKTLSTKPSDKHLLINMCKITAP